MIYFYECSQGKTEVKEAADIESMKLSFFYDYLDREPERIYTDPVIIDVR